ncbi:hypothetical protein Ahia01_000494100, partial [Argonauta hians]
MSHTSCQSTARVVTSMKTVKQPMKCESCLEQLSKYKCPKCYIRYCSLTCYKSHFSLPGSCTSTTANNTTSPAPQGDGTKDPAKRPEDSSTAATEPDNAPQSAAKRPNGAATPKDSAEGQSAAKYLRLSSATPVDPECVEDGVKVPEMSPGVAECSGDVEHSEAAETQELAPLPGIALGSNGGGAGEGGGSSSNVDGGSSSSSSNGSGDGGKRNDNVADKKTSDVQLIDDDDDNGGDDDDGGRGGGLGAVLEDNNDDDDASNDETVGNGVGIDDDDDDGVITTTTTDVGNGVASDAVGDGVTTITTTTADDNNGVTTTTTAAADDNNGVTTTTTTAAADDGVTTTTTTTTTTATPAVDDDGVDSHNAEEGEVSESSKARGAEFNTRAVLGEKQEEEGVTGIEEDEMTEDQVPPSQLQKLGSCASLRTLLTNPHLRSMLRHLNASTTNISDVMEAAMQEPIFTEFASACLSVVAGGGERDTAIDR